MLIEFLFVCQTDKIKFVKILLGQLKQILKKIIHASSIGEVLDIQNLIN